MSKTCGHNCHILRTGLECSPCKFKPTKNDTKMNYDKEIISQLKEIIKDRNKEIEELALKNKILCVQLNQVSDEPKKRILQVLPFIEAELFRAKQRNKQVLKDIKNMLEYETKTLTK